jgi:uncharacterized protein (DUF2141 family)
MVRHISIGLLVIAMCLCTGPIVSADGNDVVRLTITTRNARGRVFCGLHYTADAFPGRGADNATSPIAGTTATCEFSGVKPGMVAISAYHDENDNKKFDRNWFGVPTEGYCTSRNANGHWGPPKFEDAKFTYKGGRLELAATMIY